MIVIKADDNWYRAEQTLKNGVLSLTVKAYSSTPFKAIKKLISKTWNTTN